MAGLTEKQNRDSLKGNDLDAEVLDLDHLAQYTAGDPCLERELMGLFRTQAGQQVENIVSAFDDGAWKMATHTLKGSARSIGALRVGERAADLEEIGFEGDEGEKQAMIESLRHDLTDCLTLIDRLFPQ